MNPHHTHDRHDHIHGAGCGHATIQHEGHTDYLHDGHMHHVHGDHVDEHVLTVGGVNAAACTPSHACGEHDAAHAHGAGCGHPAVPHGDHVDYVHGGHRHAPHGKHYDEH
jgi:hypothetical protein